MKNLDRWGVSIVGNSMIRSFLIAGLVCSTACSKKKPKSPTKGDVSSEKMIDKDPVGDGVDVPSVSATKDDKAAPKEPDMDVKTIEEVPVGLRPPDLDLPTNVQQKRVKGHVSNAVNGLRANDPDKTLREARLALTVDPNSVESVALIAHAYYLKKRYETAEVALDLVLEEKGKLARSNARLYYTYGIIYEKTRRPEKARAAYEAAIKIEPNHLGALTNLGAFQLRNKQYSAAQQTFQRLTGQLGVNTAVTWTNLASAYRGQANNYQGAERTALLAKAEKGYKKALGIDRNYGGLYYNLGLLYLDAKPYPGLDDVTRLERAKTYFDEYKNKPGADQELLRSQQKLTKKLLKRAKKKAKRAAKKAAEANEPKDAGDE